MSEMKAKLVWKENMVMESEIRGIKVIMDSKDEGENKGQAPKELVLSGLCGCTAMDVIAILKKNAFFTRILLHRSRSNPNRRTSESIQ